MFAKRILLLSAVFLAVGFPVYSFAEGAPAGDVVASEKKVPKVVVSEGIEEEFEDGDYYEENEEEIYSDPADPYEKWNRKIFSFNETVDEMFLEPIARGYREYIPKWGRDRVSNFVDNLWEPVSFVNNVAQGDVEGSFRNFWRFTINSTVGIGGLFDVASQAGLEPEREDFGQTMGYYGVDGGAYIVIPFLGPSNTRDAVGTVVDAFTNPASYASAGATAGYQAMKIISNREELLDITDEIDKNSFDPYATIKSGYTQHRKKAIRDGEIAEGLDSMEPSAGSGFSLFE